MRRREPSPEFGSYLKALMERQGVAVADVARVCRVKTTFIYAILRGGRPLPEGRIEAVATAVGLTGQERERFRLEALAAYAPREVREALTRLLAESGRKRK